MLCLKPSVCLHVVQIFDFEYDFASFFLVYSPFVSDLNLDKALEVHQKTYGHSFAWLYFQQPYVAERHAKLVLEFAYK